MNLQRTDTRTQNFLDVFLEKTQRGTNFDTCEFPELTREAYTLAFNFRKNKKSTYEKTIYVIRYPEFKGNPLYQDRITSVMKILKPVNDALDALDLALNVAEYKDYTEPSAPPVPVLVPAFVPSRPVLAPLEQNLGTQAFRFISNTPRFGKNRAHRVDRLNKPYLAQN